MSLAKLIYGARGAGCGCLGAGADQDYGGMGDYSYEGDYALDVMPADYVPPEYATPGQVDPGGGAITIEAAPAFPLQTAESAWPIGSIATLIAPFPVDKGPWVEPGIVQQFRKMPNGRWNSQPGSDVNYPSLSALDLAAPVKRVDYPPKPGPGQQPQPQPQPKLWEDSEIFFPPALPALPDAPIIEMPPVYKPAATLDEATPARPKWLIPALAVGAALVLIPLFNRRRRR